MSQLSKAKSRPLSRPSRQNPISQTSKTQTKASAWGDFGSLFYQGDANDQPNHQVPIGLVVINEHQI